MIWWKIRQLIQKYSQFINFPIYLWGSKLQDSNNLAKKQIHLSHLKLQKGLLSSQDVLALDTLLNTVTDEARFKISWHDYGWTEIYEFSRNHASYDLYSVHGSSVFWNVWQPLKKEGGAQVIYLAAFLPEVDERRRNVLLLQSLITKTTHNSVDKRYSSKMVNTINNYTFLVSWSLWINESSSVIYFCQNLISIE